MNPPRGYEAKGAHWVKPDLVAEIAFTEWSDDGALRHPSFQGLRADKKATRCRARGAAADAVASVRREARNRRPRSATNSAKRKPQNRRRPRRPRRPRRAPRSPASRISHPDKLYFPEAGITKIDVAQYYERMAPRILPHVENRPLSLVRCPDGWKQQCFYQKHADKSVNAAVDRIEVPEGDGTAIYMGASSAKALVALVQWGVIELHPWGSRTPRLDRPDRLIFDFDPDDGVAWKDLVTGVELLRTLLGELDLEGFLKTTGGKGLHVVVPDSRDARLGAGERLHPRGRRLHGAHVRRPLHGDRVEGAAQGQDLHRLSAQRRRRHGHCAVRRARARERAGLHADRVGGAREGRALRPLQRAQRREPLAGQKRDPWRDFVTTKQTITKAHGKRVGFML